MDKMVLRRVRTETDLNPTRLSHQSAGPGIVHSRDLQLGTPAPGR